MNNSYLYRLLVFLLFLPLLGWGQQPGNLDRSFNYGMGSNYQFAYTYGANNSVLSIASQPDNKIITGGAFTTMNGASRSRIARLNANGSLDSSFNIGTGADSSVSAIAIQADGKIIIGGLFTAYNGTTRNRIARLNADGSLDANFNPGTGTNNSVYSIAIQADGKILIGGNFTSFNGTNRNYIARLNADGGLDTSFNVGTGANNTVRSIVLQADGKVIIAGAFTNYNGTARNRIARLNSDGSLDASFNNIAAGANNLVWTTAIDTSGKIIIGGAFTTYNGTNRTRIARLNIDGSLDTSFNPRNGANNTVLSTVIQPDGKIIIGGQFNYYINDYKSKIARLNTNGSLDATFNIIGTNTITGTDGTINAIALQPNSNILLGGGFTSYSSNSRNRIACLNANGSLDANFHPNTGANINVLSSALQPDGKIIIGGTFSTYNGTTRNKIARINTDGSLDFGFNPGTGAGRADGGYPDLNSVTLQPDNKIIIGGYFTDYNGVNRNRIARINPVGNLDTTFNPGAGANNTVYATAVQPDGKIIIGGDFDTYNGTARSRIARLNADGTLDLSFNPRTGATRAILAIALQPDGKILIGGTFTTFHGTSRNCIARLNTDGRLDTSFNPGSGITGGAEFYIQTIALQPDGKILIGGTFRSYNGIVRKHIARLNPNGSLDLSFNSGTGGAESFGYTVSVRSILLQPDGKMIIGGVFTSFNGVVRGSIARLYENGSVDQSFNPGSGISGPPTVFVGTILLQPDDKIVIGGYFNAYNNLSTFHIARIHLSDGGCIQPIRPTVTGHDTICGGYTTTLTSNAVRGNLWSTGDTTQSITVGLAGSYTVSVVRNGCTSAVSTPFVVVNNGPVATTINYDTNSITCLGSRIALTPAGNFAHYLWSNGERTRSITTRYGGQYSVQVANADSCFGSPSPSISISFGLFWCTVEIYREGLDSLSANLWADYYIWYLNGIELLSSNTQKTIPIQGDGVYTFRAVNGASTSPLSNPIVITSSKKSINAPKIKLHPNPSSGMVTLTTSPDAESITITNAVGQVVYATKAQAEMELNLNHLANGIYMVQVQSSKGVSTQRLEIQ